MNEPNLRNQAKAALENMYMFGGMPKPDPKYDEYLNRMLEIIVAAAKDPEPVTNEEIRKAAESRINEAYELLERIEGLDESATSCLDMVKMSVSIAAQETYELYLEL